MFRKYLILFMFFFLPTVNAADYKWFKDGSSFALPSAQAVCDRYKNDYGTCSYTECRDDKGLMSATATVYPDGTAICQVYSEPSHFKHASFGAYRTGDSCKSGSTYNPTTGACVASQVCEQNWSGGEKVWSVSQGACVKYPNLSAAEFCKWSAGKSMGGQMEVNSNSATGPAQFINNSQCVMTANTAKADCATRVNSDGLGSYRCKVTGSYSGEYNANGTNKPDGYCSTGDCTEPPVKPPVPTPTPSEIKDSKPCVYTAGADGVQSCTSSNLVQKEGTSNCGTVNGVWQCLDKKPTSQGIVIATKLQTDTKPDGSTTTTKTDTAVSTTCAGIGDCKSTTTTTTTTTTKNGAGVVTGVTGSCTGPQCPDVNTNPDGNGDGFGDCTGEDCGSEGGSSVPGDLELDEVPTFEESASIFYGRISSSPIPLAMARIRAPTGGICPRYLVTTYIGDVDYSAHCDLIEDKRSLIFLIARTLWALFAAWILFG